MMNALEFLKEQKRMCKKNNCKCCPLDNIKMGEYCQTINASDEDLLKRIEEVEQWSIEHPQKTYTKDFLEKFPKAILKNLCRNNIYNNPSSICNYIGYGPLERCKECWNEKMEE